MKNKSNFLVKAICSISILISLLVFGYLIINFEDAKIKLASIEKVDVESEKQEEVVKPAKIEFYEVVYDEEHSDEQPQKPKDIVTEETEKSEENTENYVEIELNNENCDYSIDSENNTVKIDEYYGWEDCIVIPNEIDGKKVEEVNTENFSNSTNLETIKVSKEIATKIEEIPNFEVNESLEEEDYIVYTTTREYGEAYRGYLELSEEEKEEMDFIPPKYEIPLEIKNENENINLQSVGWFSNQESYDLRNDIPIKVENQNPYGICYAYAAFTAAETYWALNHGETIDFSEVHGAVLTTGNGGNYNGTNNYFYSQIGPVYEEEIPVYEVRHGIFNNSSRFVECLESSSPSSYSDVQSIAKSKKPEKYVTETYTFPTITQAMKKNSSYATSIEETRLDIKEHIVTYGGLAAITNSNYMGEYNGKIVQNDQSSSGINHGVTIIGWDDNFATSNFPSSSRPSKNGAYLVLNSWGNGWGDDGCYWISYEDKWIEYWLVGVTEMTEIAENLQTSSIVVTDQETGEIIDNANIKDGTKIKIELEASITNKIAGAENVEVKLRDNIGDYTSYLTVTGNELVDKKADLEILLDTAEIIGNQYILEISYGDETVYKMIETPQDYCYSINADGTITLEEYFGTETEITIPAEYEGYKVSTIGTDAFSGAGLEKVTIEEGITTLQEYAFRSNTKLVEINLPRTLKTIGDGAFLGCSKIEQIIIPRSVTKIGIGLVQRCSNLKKLVIFKEATTIGHSMLYLNPNAAIYCEDNSTVLNYAKSYSYPYYVITENYDITYNENAGEDIITNMPSTQSKVKYDTIDLSSNIPVRAGYEFLGWSTSAISEEVEYLPGDAYREDKNLNLYAVWEGKEREISFIVEYYKDNVKQDTDSEQQKITVDFNGSNEITVDKTKINTKDKYKGYKFVKTEPAVIPDTVNAGDVIKVYYSIETYNISYDLNGGALESGKTNPTTYTVNDKFTLNNPEKDGYTFTGWTGSNGNTPQKTITFDETTGDKQYVANFVVTTYKLTYKIDGVQFGQPESYEYGATIIPKENPTKYGYKFSGWSGVPETMPAHDVVVTGTYTIDPDQTKELSYTVEYYKEGIKQEKDTQTEKITVQVLKANTITVDKSKINTENKYMGYCLEKTEPSTIPDIVDNGDVIKVYYVLEPYKVTYNLDGGTLENGKTNPARYTVNDEFTLNNPIKTGYTFIGWTGSNGEVPEITVTLEKGSTGDKNYVANYTINTYTISYDLNGGLLESGKTNPETYTIKDSITLNNPEKEGYTFIGWTGSNGDEPQKTVTIKKSTGNRNYVANYEINTYTLTYKVDGEVFGEIETYEYGEAIVPRQNPEKEGYKFSGWSEVPETMPAHDVVVEGTFSIDETKIKQLEYTIEYYKDNVKQDSDTVTENLTVHILQPDTLDVDKTKINTKDKYKGYKFEKTEPEIIPDKINTGEIIKIYYTLENYNIAYNLNGGHLENGKTNPENYTIHDEFTLNNPEKEGYTFVGWTGSNGEEPQKVVTVKESTGNKNYVANYKVNTYKLTIKYNHYSGNQYPREYVEEYEFGKTYSIQSPIIPGYTCDAEVISGTMGAIDKTIEVNYTANTDTKYVVEHYKQNIEDDEFTLCDTENMKGTTDTETSAASKDYEGFTTQEFNQLNISGDESTIIKIYYTRNKYTLTYKLDGEQYGEIETYKYGQSVIAKEDLEKYGYIFSGWDTIPETMPAKNVEVVGSFSIDKTKVKELNYTIEYYKDNEKQDADTIEEKITVQILQPDTLDVDKTKINTENKYRGYKFEKTIPEIIPDKINTGEVIKVYYSCEIYDVSYELNGGILKNGDANPENYTVHDEFTLCNPEKEGYTFIGWTGSNGEEPQKVVTVKDSIGNKKYVANYSINTYKLTINYIHNSDKYPKNHIEELEFGKTYNVTSPLIPGYTCDTEVVSGTIGAGDETIEVKYTANTDTKYVVEHYKQNLENEEFTLCDFEEKTGTTDTLTVAKSKGYEGFTTQKITQEKIAGDESTVIKIYYNRNQYTLSYKLDGEQYGEVETYKYEQNVNMKANPEKYGYKFSGWSENIEKMPAKNVEILGTFSIDENLLKELSYTIEYYKDGIKQDSDTIEEKVTVQILKPDELTVDKSKINTENKYVGYSFDKTEPATIPDIVNAGDVIKIYYVLENYNVSYDLDGGSLAEEKTNPETYTVYDEFTLNNPEKEGYTFIGWTGSNGEEPQETVKIEKGTTGNKTYKANYNINTYTLTYKVDGEQYGETETYEYGKTIVARENPEKEGYKFSGWSEVPETMPAHDVVVEGTFSIDETKIKVLSYTVEYYKNNVKQDADTQLEEIMVHILQPDELTVDKTKINVENKYVGYSLEKTEPAEIPDVIKSGEIIKVYYTANIDTKYIVEHYKQNIENDEYTLFETQESAGTTDTLTQDIAKNIEGFTSKEFNPENIAGDGSTVLKIYYDRNKYTLTYFAQPDIDEAELFIDSSIYKYEQKINPISYPERYGYKFSGWIDIPETMPSHDVDVSGYLYIDESQTKEISYTIEYYKKNIKQEEDTITEKITVQVLKPDIITVDKTKINTENKYEGFVFEKIEPEVVPDVVENGTVIKIYYSLEKYNITYDLDGGKILNGNNPENYTVEDEITLIAPEKEGYTFIGWTGSNGDVPEMTVTVEKGSTGDKNYVANYTINTYTISYDLNGGALESGKTNPETYTIHDGFTLNNPEKEGYTFIGWTGSNGEDPQKSIIIETGTTGNKQYTANYTINSYKLEIEYITDWGPVEPPAYSEYLEFGTEYKIVSPEILGYSTDTPVVEGVMGAEDILIYVFYTAHRVSYTVNHYKQNIYDDGYTLYETKTEEGIAGWQAEPMVEEYTGFEFDKYVGGEELSPLGTTVVDVYYNRIIYTVKYFVDGEQYGETEYYKYEQEVEGTRKKPTKIGYNCVGWYGPGFFGDAPFIVDKDIEINADFVLERYDITYDLDGGKILNGNNPETYTIHDGFTLNNPEKEGYTFIGWTGSNGDVPEMTVTVEEGSTGDKNYVANYTINTYTLTYKVDGEIYGEIERYDYGQNIIPKENPTKYGYKFSGWSEIPETMPAHDVDVSGYMDIDESQTKEISYTIEYYKKNIKQEEDTITEKITVQVLKPDTITVDKSKINTENKYEGFVFEKIEPEVVPDVVENGTVIKIYYSLEKYNITYDLDGGKLAEGNNPEKYTREDSFSLIAPEKEGYTFIGWTGSNGDVPEMTVTVEEGSTGDKNYVANYAINTYTISYDLDGGEILNGNNPENYTIEDEITLIAPEKEGYTFIGWTGSNGEEPQETVKIEKGTTGNKTYKANYIINTYTLTYKIDGEVCGEIESYEYGQIIIPKENPTKYGYNFSGWSEIPETMPAHDVVVTGTYTIDPDQTKELSYTVEYYKDGIKQDADIQIEKVTVQVLKPDTITVDKAKINTENKYIGYCLEKTEPATIPDIVNTGDVIKVYYVLEPYKLTYELNGGALENGKTNPETYTIKDAIILNNPEKEGYTFIGWTGSNGDVPEITVIVEEGSTGDKNYVANYTINTYTISYDLDGGEILNGNNPENYTIEDEITLIAPEKEGYTFIGWTGSNGEETQKAVTIKESTGNKTYKANYNINTYTLTYKVDGEQYGETETYEYGKTIVAKENPEKEGYKFSGWSEVPETMPAHDVVVEGTFSIDETKIKTLSYTVEYYKNNVKQDADTQLEETIVHILQPDELTVDKTKINVENKYVGYSLEKTEPAEIPNVIKSGEIIKVYYTANIDTKYIVEHYKQNIENDDYTLAETVECVGKTDNIAEAEIRAYEGFTSKEFEPENIAGDGSTVLKIYYDRNKYTITYKIDGEVYGEIEEYKYEETITPKENLERYGYKFSGWSEIPEKMPANDIEILGTFTKDETQTKELIYTVEYYKDDVKQEEDTDIEKVTVHVLDSDEMFVDKEKINVTNKYEGCMVDEEKTVIPDKVTTGETIKVYYIRKEAKVNVEYRDIVTGEEITEKVIKIAKVFDTYDITEDKKEIEGYIFVEGPENLTGEYTEEEQTKIFKYAKKSKVTVNYIDKNSKENLSESIIIEGYETKDYETEEKEFENYALVEIEGNKSGKMTSEELTINYYYIYISQGVIEKHIDIITNDILCSEVHEGNEGDNYKTESKVIDGYSLVKKKLPNNAEGKMTKEAIIVEYFYIRNTRLKVQYINKLTDEILYEEIREGSENDSYTTKEKEFKEYKIVEKPDNAYGKMAVTKDENNNVITETVVKYYYKKVSKGVVVRHYDMQDYKLLKEEIYSGLEGDAYKAEPKEFEGYDVVKEKLPTNAEGVMTIAEIEVNYFYKKGKNITSEEYLINEDDIKKIVMKTTVSDFVENMNIREEYTILDHEGNVVSEDEIVKTGMKLKLESGKEYDLIVRGDINGDGRVSLIDLSKLILHYNGMKGFILDGIPYKAADMNYDDKVSLIDVSQMLVFYNSI